eukprot:3288327-Rhodomonas_salina.1
MVRPKEKWRDAREDMREREEEITGAGVKERARDSQLLFEGFGLVRDLVGDREARADVAAMVAVDRAEVAELVKLRREQGEESQTQGSTGKGNLQLPLLPRVSAAKVGMRKEREKENRKAATTEQWEQPSPAAKEGNQSEGEERQDSGAKKRIQKERQRGEHKPRDKDSLCPSSIPSVSLCGLLLFQPRNATPRFPLPLPCPLFSFFPTPPLVQHDTYTSSTSCRRREREAGGEGRRGAPSGRQQTFLRMKHPWFPI